jgi:excisionase family DNA binding protein
VLGGVFRPASGCEPLAAGIRTVPDPLTGFAEEIARRLVEAVVPMVVGPVAEELRRSGQKLAYTVAEASDALGLSEAVVYALVKSGQLRSVREGSRIVISRGALEEYLGDRPARRMQ